MTGVNLSRGGAGESEAEQAARRRGRTACAPHYVYDEWDYEIEDYRAYWCELREVGVAGDNGAFFSCMLATQAALSPDIKRQFQRLRPKMFQPVTGLEDREDVGLNAAVAARVARCLGHILVKAVLGQTAAQARCWRAESPGQPCQAAGTVEQWLPGRSGLWQAGCPVAVRAVRYADGLFGKPSGAAFCLTASRLTRAGMTICKKCAHRHAVWSSTTSCPCPPSCPKFTSALFGRGACRPGWKRTTHCAVRHAPTLPCPLIRVLVHPQAYSHRRIRGT